MKSLDQYANQKMQIKDNTKLAIIAGSGDLVLNCVKNCHKKNINVFLIGIDGFYVNKNYKANLILSLNKIGNIFSILKNKEIKNILFIGSIQKPSLFKLRPNILTLYYLSLILFNYFRGDDNLLNKIFKIFNEKGFKILDVRKILRNNVANNLNNNLEKYKKKINLKQVEDYFNLAKKIGSLDKGQAIIINKGNVLLREDKKGTDNLISRYKFLNREDEFSILVKTSKPNQNLYFDLPTIGPNTIKNIFISGIKGIIVEKNNSLIAKPNETFKLIKKYNLFYYAL